MNKHIIKICTVGLDSQCEKMFHLVFENIVDKNVVLTKESDADACIFDFDSLHAKERWQTYRKQHPHTPVIVLSLYDKSSESPFFVKKPVDLNFFMYTFNQLKKDLQKQQVKIEETNSSQPKKEELILRIRSVEKHTLQQATDSFEKKQIATLSNYAEYTVCGQEPDIDPNDNKAILKVSYEQSRRLQGLIEKSVEIAKNSGCVNRLKFAMGELLINPANHCILSSVKEQTLNSLMLLPMKNLNIETQLLSPNQAKEYIKNAATPFYYECLDGFLWKTAILTSHGRVPMGTDLTAPVILTRWPNFSRLMLTQHALQITALWADIPCSLIETAKLLQIPQRYVFSLYSAMVALNLAGIASGIAPHKKFSPFAINSEKRGLFQRLLAKLSF